MTYDEKLSICRLRIKGKSVAAIAKEVGFSNQAVFGFLQKLPHAERETHIRPDCSSKRILSLCADYFSGASISTLAANYKMEEKDVLDVFSYLAEKRLPLYLSPRDGWDDVFAVMRDFPRLTVILTDYGLWGSDRYVFPLVKNYKHFYIESSDY